MKALLKKFPFLQQFGKFLVTGVLNTGIDFGVLSLLMWVSGQNQGFYVLLFTTISFATATVNSFFLNKYWTFGNRKKRRIDSQTRDFTQFIIITIGGWLINAGLTSLIGGFISPFFGNEILSEWLHPEKLQSLWVLTAKAFATGVSLLWNFTGYKLWVFRK